MAKPCIVETSKLVVPTNCSLDGQSLLGGQLLKWLDIVACLAAEKHAGSACVTASADDLHIARTVRSGQVLNLKARVNRAFNTSMEVEVAAVGEDLDTRSRNPICRVFFTFVTQPDEEGKKRYLNPVQPSTEEERTEYYLASERKSMRLEYRKSLQEMKNNPTRKASLYGRHANKTTEQLSPSITSCESVEIVLPEHANHHGTTFGGQLMAWMEATASISARRLCCHQASLIAVDEVVFRGPSHVGDRIVIKSMVNNTFDKSMEVGARVEAYAVGGMTRHIESAYFTYMARDEDGSPLSLPQIINEVEEQKYRMSRALKRVRLRQDRNAILRAKSSSIAVPWTTDNQKILSYKSIYELCQLQQLVDWKLASAKDGISLQRTEHDGFPCVRCQLDVPVSASRVYELLCRDSMRSKWDPLFLESDVVRAYHEGQDVILHIVLRNPQPGKNVRCDDMVVLVSKRTSQDRKDPFTISYRSITLDEKPPCPEYNRAENRCSGFLIYPLANEDLENDAGSRVYYINQLSQEALQYAEDVLEVSAVHFMERGRCLRSYLVSAAADQD